MLFLAEAKKKETVSFILAAQSLKKWVGKDGFEPPKA